MLYLQGILAQVILSYLFIRLTEGAAASERFIDPPDDIDNARGLTYTRGALVQIVWQTDLDRIALTLWHSASAPFEYLGHLGGVGSRNVSNRNSYPWLVDTKEDISINTFFFRIFHPGNKTSAFQSRTFKIIDAPSGSTGTATAFSAASVSKFIISTSPTSLIITSTYSLNHESSTAIITNSGISTATATNSRISQSAKTGLGVGIGIGIPLLLAMGIYLGWKFRGRRTAPSGSKEGHNAPVDTPINDRVERFQPAGQENSGMRMNNFADSHQAPWELPPSRPDELYSTPIHQIE
ncbi:hypothetical protein MMC22_002183 [Lobaria immixta]|nr:hypothetical protein [Lobaria immixta]